MLGRLGKFGSIALTGAVIACCGRPAVAAEAALAKVEVQRHDGQVRIVMTMTQPVTPALSTAAGPDRVLLDFLNTTSAPRQRRIAVNDHLVESVRYGLNQSNPPVTRVVVDLHRMGRYAVTVAANQVVLTVSPVEAAAARPRGGAPGAGRGPWINLSRAPSTAPDATDSASPPPSAAPASAAPNSITVSFDEKAPSPAAARPVVAAQVAPGTTQLLQPARTAEPGESQSVGQAGFPALNAAPAKNSIAPPAATSAGSAPGSTSTAGPPASSIAAITPAAAPAEPAGGNSATVEASEATPSSSAPTLPDTSRQKSAPSSPPAEANPAATANSDLRTRFRVKYVAEGAAYLDGGRSSGLAEGVKLYVKDDTAGSAADPRSEAASSPSAPGNAPAPAVTERPPAMVAELHVISVAESSAVCEIVSPSRPVKAGDLAYLDSAAAEALVQQRALSSTRLYPQVITFTEGDPLDEEQREEVPRPPLPEVNRARGRFGFDYGGIRSGGANALSSNQFGLVMRTDITRIGGTYWNLSGYWRGRLDSRGSTGQQTLQDTINRTYHLALTYDNPNSRLVAGFGRLYLPWASSLDTIDGGYVGERIAKGVTAGLFAGSTPDPTSWSYNPDRRIAGTFVNFDGGAYDNWKYTSTAGLGVSTLLWRIDRPFVFFENGIFYKRYLSIYHSLQADAPRGNPQTPSPGAGISRSYFTLRIQPVARLSFDFNHNYFRDIPTFDLNLVGTGLLDKVLFQGMSVGARAEVIKKVFLYTEQGRSKRSGDARSSWNQMYGITFANLMKTGLRADLHYSKFDSSFAQGHYEALSLSRSLRENMRWEVQAGRQSFVSPFSSANGSKFVNMSLDANLGARYFVQGGYTVQRGNIMNYDQWYFTLGYRFDNRQGRK